MRRLAPMAAVAALFLPLMALAQPAPARPETPAAKPKYDEDTPFGVLLKDPAARDVLTQDWPLLVTAVDMGGVPSTNTMKDALVSESARTKGGLTDEIFAKVIADLKKL